MSAAAALIPVVLFLAALFLMDSFKLVPLRAVAAAVGFGAAAALAALWFIGTTVSIDDFGPDIVSRYVAPVIEEVLKAAPIIVLIARGRVGFLVDAGVQGFAVGAGFALVENVVYLRALQDAPITLWLVRGLGTAVLHGATTAIFAIGSKALADRHPDRLPGVFVSALAVAIAIHSAFNHLLLPPLAQTGLILAVLPLLLIWVFDRSDRATREWIGAGLDLDVDVLQLVESESFSVTRFSQYLLQLRARFPGTVVADMYCLLRLELELTVQAKAVVMARAAGLHLAPDDDLAASLAERDYLQRSIGPTGLLALKPLQVTGYRDKWHRHLLRA